MFLTGASDLAEGMGRMDAYLSRVTATQSAPRKTAGNNPAPNFLA